LFGVGAQELLIIGLLVIVVFGPLKAVGMAQDLGRFVSGAKQTVEEFKSELLIEEVKEARRTVEEIKGEVADAQKEADPSLSRPKIREHGTPEA
jgi:Sec-independent protein translocase protein TatA